MDVFSATPPAWAACRAVLDRLGPDDGARPTPCPDLTVDGVVDHLHLAMVRLGGLAGAELRQSDPLDELVPAALDAWRRRGLDGEVDLRGPLPAIHAAAIVPMELVVHGWDLATAVGAPFAVDDEVVDHLLAVAPHIVEARRGKAYGPEVAPPADATPLQRLIAYTGRAV
ncbi:DinB family protein [Jatrophihabitans fulvus]